MSNWREQFGDESVLRASLLWFGRYYHYIVLVSLAGFVFWNRARNWGNFVVNGEILFRGNDPWYHYRSVRYITENFPGTMPFDPWTYFPHGTSTGQFGTFYDQIVATVALVVGLGSPSEEIVKLIALFTPAVVAVLIVIPTYVIGRRLGGRFGGVLGVVVFALATDRLLSLSVVGFFDHHVAESLTQALAVLGVMVAIRVAERDKPVYELLRDREFGVLRRSLGWATLAGIAIGVYLWVWPPGVFLIGILGVFFVVHLSGEYVRGRSPEHAAFAGAVALGVAGTLQLSTVTVVDIAVTSKSLLQPGLAFAVAGGCVFMAWLSREWDSRDVPPLAYPVAVLGLIAVGAGVVAVALPSLFEFFVDQTLRVVGFQTSPTTGTIGEAQPLPPRQLYGDYSLALFTAIAGGLILLAKQFRADEARGEHLLVVIWFVFIVAATLTQARFGYYLTVPVAVLNAAFVGTVMHLIGGVDESVEVEAYQVLTVVAVLLVVVAPMALIGSGPVRTASAAQSPGGGIVGWQNSLEWMADNTPREGQYGNANGEPMEYYGTFDRTDDFEYSAGAYGVMSWWDYGHWITAKGERIPNANPFQQGPRPAAAYLLSQNETQSLAVLEGIDEDDAQTRVVMVDWKMVQAESLSPVRGKFFAPPTWIDGSDRPTYYSRIIDTNRLQETGLYGATLAMRHKQPYYNSTMVRLYLYHGSAMEPRPHVLDWQGGERDLGNGETFVSAPQQGHALKRFPNMSAARAYVDQDGTSQVGGFGPYPSERVPAMKHYRLVHTSNVSALQGRETLSFRRDLRQSGLGQQLQAQLGEDANQSSVQRRALQFLYPNAPAWTKTFERVEGATVEGTGPENATLQLRVQMRPRNGFPFTYSQRVETDASGEFSTTVPYSTTGYGEFGPENGYTNTSVRAAGPYSIASNFQTNESGYLFRWSGTVNVTEGQVVGADGSPATVDMQKQILREPSNGNGNETAGNETTANETDGSGTASGTDGSGSGSDSENNESQSMPGPETIGVEPAPARS